MYTTEQLFSLEHTLAAPLLERHAFAWAALPELEAFIRAQIEALDRGEYVEIAPEAWAHRSARIASTAQICGPCIIGAGTEVRHCAFIRGSALVGKDCVVGNSVELKNAILFDRVQVPHFNYVGDSILGYRAHMGAGAVTSNVKSDGARVKVHDGAAVIETGLQKFGALLGDCVEVGCNSVLNPGTIVGRESNVYPLSCVRGVVPERSIWKTGGVVVKKWEC